MQSRNKWAEITTAEQQLEPHKCHLDFMMWDPRVEERPFKRGDGLALKIGIVKVSWNAKPEGGHAGQQQRHTGGENERTVSQQSWGVPPGHTAQRREMHSWYRAQTDWSRRGAVMEGSSDLESSSKSPPAKHLSIWIGSWSLLPLFIVSTQRADKDTGKTTSVTLMLKQRGKLVYEVKVMRKRGHCHLRVHDSEGGKSYS